MKLLPFFSLLCLFGRHFTEHILWTWHLLDAGDKGQIRQATALRGSYHCSEADVTCFSKFAKARPSRERAALRGDPEGGALQSGALAEQVGFSELTATCAQASQTVPPSSTHLLARLLEHTPGCCCSKNQGLQQLQLSHVSLVTQQ